LLLFANLATLPMIHNDRPLRKDLSRPSTGVLPHASNNILWMFPGCGR
jgi:hypothetical protein